MIKKLKRIISRKNVLWYSFIFSALLCTLMIGCEHVATNDEIIAETKKCADAGLSSQVRSNGLTGEIIGIQCIPK